MGNPNCQETKKHIFIYSTSTQGDKNLRERKSKLIHNQESRRTIFEERGRRCVGCGYTGDKLVLHHIVPTSLGGLDEPENIAILCYECHSKIHNLDIGELRKPFANFDGRPRKCSPEEEEKYYSQYINCEIGTKELKEKTKTAKTTAISDKPGFKEYLKRHGIKRYRNNIDIIYANGKSIVPGTYIGFVEYEDGTLQEFYFKDTATKKIAT